MNWITKFWNTQLAPRLLGVAVNEDRAVASAIWAKTDWTISGEAGKRPALKPLADVLDATLPGGPHGKHSENAAYDDAAQQAALTAADTVPGK